MDVLISTTRKPQLQDQADIREVHSTPYDIRSKQDAGRRCLEFFRRACPRALVHARLDLPGLQLRKTGREDGIEKRSAVRSGGEDETLEVFWAVRIPGLTVSMCGRARLVLQDVE